MNNPTTAAIRYLRRVSSKTSIKIITPFSFLKRGESFIWARHRRFGGKITLHETRNSFIGCYLWLIGACSLRVHADVA